MKKEKGVFLHYGWIVLAVGTISLFGAVGLGRFGYSTILPNMQAGLGIDNGQAGLLATMGLIGYMALTIIGGALASRHGSRLIASLGLVVVGLGMVFMGLSDKFISVALWSLLAGVGTGAVHISIFGLFPAWFSKKRRGLASGIAISGGSIGMIFSGIIVPLIITRYGENAWQFSWLLFGVVTLVIAVIAYSVLRNKPAEKGLQPIGGEEEITPGTSDTGPGLESVYTLPAVWILALVYALFGFAYIIFMSFFVKHLSADAGFTEAAAMRLFMIMGWISLLSGLIWGSVSDFIGRKRTLVMLYMIHGLSFGLFGLGGKPVYFVLAAVFFGLSSWSVPAIMAATCGDMLGPDLAPAGLGFVTLFMGIGQVLGPVAAGLVADAVGSFFPVFIITSVVSLTGAIIIALFVKNAEQRAGAAKYQESRIGN